MNRAKSEFYLSMCPAPLVWAVFFATLQSAPAQTVPTLDLNFKPVLTQVGGYGTAVAVPSDGKILFAGAFNAINGVAENGLARLNTDGSVDPTFNTGPVCCGSVFGQTQIAPPITALTIQGDSKILLGGFFTNVNGVARAGLARLNADGSLDMTFDPGSGLLSPSSPGGNAPVVSMVVQPDGKVLVGGYFTAINGVTRHGIARLNANGSVDMAFDPAFALAIGDPIDVARLHALALLPSGQVLVAGEFQSFNYVPSSGLVRLNANGTLDDQFGPSLGLQGTPPGVNGMLVQSDGQILISGAFEVINNELRYSLARLKPDGNLDPAFNPNVDSSSSESYRLLALQPDGKIVAYHEINDANGNVHRSIARLNTDSTPDPTFNVDLSPRPGSTFTVAGAALQADGQVLIAGNFLGDPSGRPEGLARLSTAGKLDAAFAPRLETAEGPDGNVSVLSVQTDGKILLGGAFNLVSGVGRTNFARLNRDGSLDPNFSPALQSADSRSAVSAILAQPDGKILIGGVFTAVNGTNRNGIARLNADGSLDDAFDVGTGTGDGGVSALALQSDGKVLVAGNFSQINGVQIQSLARLGTNGHLDLSYRTSFPPDGQIQTLGVLSNGPVMIGGAFDRIESLFVPGFARLTPDGSLDPKFANVTKTDEFATSLVVGPDDKTTAAIQSSDPSVTANLARLLRLNTNGTLDVTFNPPQIVGDSSSAATVTAMVLDPAGRLVIAGSFSSVGGTPHHGLARFNPDGTLDTNFDAGAGFGNAVFQASATSNHPLVAGVGLQDDGGIVVGGSFGTVNNQIRLGVARFQADKGTPPDGGGPGGGSQPKISSPSRVANGPFSMLVSGQVGVTYRVEASTDLRSWTSVGTVTGAASPQPFTDASAATSALRFYRVAGP